MFTGIVSAQGEIKLIKKNNSYTSLSIDAPKGFAKNIKKGGSISVNGVCLTIKSAHSDKLRFQQGSNQRFNYPGSSTSHGISIL